MLYIHENNLDHKIIANYKGKRTAIEAFKNDCYIPMREQMLSLNFSSDNDDAFEEAAEICNGYYEAIELFSDKYGITSQSKFASTFLEEISAYLFKDLPAIKKGVFSVFNKGIYAGMKIAGEDDIAIIKKDVDFCIGKKINISIDDAYREEIILPIVAVEVKTYLDATMFGEIKSSSKAIRSATPNSKAYVLMGYKDLANEHIIAARQDATLTEMFALRRSKYGLIEASALYDYWNEISDAVNSISEEEPVNSLGKLLYPEK
ncbi:MAG: Bpu10I family restriction endonuclease [Bacillota bacterium]|nr:Bpu10I family restriction endonuclease [Bacillota bacterium]